MTYTCYICGYSISVEEHLRRKDLNLFPEVFYPGVSTKDDKIAHVECLIGEGVLEVPKERAEYWKSKGWEGSLKVRDD